MSDIPHRELVEARVRPQPNSDSGQPDPGNSNNQQDSSKLQSRNQRRRANKNKRAAQEAAQTTGNPASESAANISVLNSAQEERKGPVQQQPGGGRGRNRLQTAATRSEHHTEGAMSSSTSQKLVGEANAGDLDRKPRRRPNDNRQGGATQIANSNMADATELKMNPDVSEFVPRKTPVLEDKPRTEEPTGRGRGRGRGRGNRSDQQDGWRGRGGRGGRGRDGLPHGVNPQNEERDAQGRGRGGRGDGNRNRGERNHGPGAAGAEGQRRPARGEFFEHNRREKQANDQDTNRLLQEADKRQILTQETLIHQSAAQVGSRKENTRQGKRTYKNLGAASKFIDGDDNREIKAFDKLQFVKKGDRFAKDKAKIKYNFRDFLNQFENLSEQCVFLVESLTQGSQECMICHNPIYQRSALWNCQQCCQPFHLGCIKRWILKLNKSLEQNIRDNEEEEKRGVVEYQSDEESEEEKTFDEGKGRFLAFYNWTCPNCQFAYAENKMPRYTCYCGRFEEPDYDPMILPHSCGEYCDRPKNKDCVHANCNISCHPGACPPCNISVSVRCHCSRQMKYVPCQVASRSQFSCEDVCNKRLNCGIHTCEQLCHAGACSPCSVPIQQECFCGKKVDSTLCGSPQVSCHEKCGRDLDCTHHQCEKVCHAGKCLPCQKDPSRQIYCPSGHKTVESLLGRQRKSCIEPVPVCDALCEKFLPCGRHQCIKQCHNEECMRCEEMVNKGCVCNKTKTKFPCYQIYYPDHLRSKLMTKEEMNEVDTLKCKRVCNQVKKCQKHHCKEVCCPVRGQDPDREGRHLCMIVCNKKLSCGQHECTEFCHIGFCPPCKYVSAQPLFCPCGIAKLDPPIKCGVPLPSCKGPCKQKLPCEHPCSMLCHAGNCPPCLETVTRLCNCGKELMTNIFCHKSTPNCGQVCKTQLSCGHKCQKVCHPAGKCFKSQEDLLLNGCGERCLKIKPECGHKCMSPCHPDRPCPSTPCEAELRVYCSCGAKWVEVTCKSNPNRPPIECDARCWKKQRDARIASAFGSSQDFMANKDSIKFEYYPEEAIQFALENLAWVKKIEMQMTYIVLNKSTKHYTHLTGGKRTFLTLLVHEHFKLDMCVYGQLGQKRVTDVFWRDGCKVPEIMCSEIAEMISKGIEEVKTESNISSIFEATLLINNVVRGNTIDQLKKFLANFKNEIYTEKGATTAQFKVHFYSFQRAREALSFIQYTPNPFSNCQLIKHAKEVGTHGEVNLEEFNQAHAQAAQHRPRRRNASEDSNGFQKIVNQ